MWPAASPSWAIRIKNRFSAGYKKPSEIIGFNHRTGASYYLPIFVCTLPLAIVYIDSLPFLLLQINHRNQQPYQKVRVLFRKAFQPAF
jgi:hypothetical protein